jgi:hypothetical protein
MEELEVQDPEISNHPDSLTSLFYTLQFTFLRITLHTFAAGCLILRLHSLPFVFAYKASAKRASTLFRVLKSAFTSPTRTIRNLYRLYCIISSQPQIVERAETPVPRVDDAVSVESILLKRLGVQEYHETLHEVRCGDSPELSTSLPAAASELAHEGHQNTLESSKPDLQPVLSPIVNNPQDGNGCPECVHERLGCVTCNQVTRNSSVDSSRIPRRAKSDSEFHPPLPPNDEYWKLPWRQVQAKKSGKLQKRVPRY